ncbi:hypothetical protein ACFVXG_39655 [Kitasatospora sp. NPDC058162]|uniref:hypothetical protein n=1 Tax=Kitasatospora sp. NPDC058162 TaxID=3346362 RepID=UPI0036DB15A6
MILLLVHVLLPPVLLAAVSWVGRRCGPAVGGLVAGLPLTSGPIVVFAALDHGAPFAAGLAAATVGGAAGATLLCWVYARRSARQGPWPALAAACATFLLSGIAQQFAALGLAATGVLAGACLLAVLRWWPTVDGGVPLPARPDVPLAGRAAVVTGYVLAATAAAGAVGPRITGLLSPFPVLVVTQALHLHRRSDRRSAVAFLRGVMDSQFALLVWSMLLAVLLPTAGFAVAVGTAAVSATVVQLLVATAGRHPRRPRSPAALTWAWSAAGAGRGPAAGSRARSRRSRSGRCPGRG